MTGACYFYYVDFFELFQVTTFIGRRTSPSLIEPPEVTIKILESCVPREVRYRVIAEDSQGRTAKGGPRLNSWRMR